MYIENYNWDDGLSEIKRYIETKELSLYDLIQVFYDAGGYVFLMNGMDKKAVIEKDLLNEEYVEFLFYLHERIKTVHQIEGNPSSPIHHLSKTQIYLIRKRNPDVLSCFYRNGGGDKYE